MQRKYISIDLKSFYASVECADRGLDPMDTNLVVADDSRTKKTICLAVSPSLKSISIPGRPRLFEVEQKVRQENIKRRIKNKNKNFRAKSFFYSELKEDESLEIDYITAKPRMSHYINYSNRIYQIYLRYVSSKDIHVYSIDEVFIDVTDYLAIYNMTAREFAAVIMKSILEETKITATCGIGTNLYLCKVAMDIVAKNVKPDKDGTRIAEIDEISYRKKLWDLRPISYFWRVGKGYRKKLEQAGIYTMGDVARCSIENEDLLFSLFGKNAELLIDHAWGIEPCTISDIKKFKPQTKSIGNSQVLHKPYTAENARLVTWEMADILTLELVDKRYVTNQIVLTVGYDIENLKNPAIRSKYRGEIKTDSYGRKIPKHSHGSINLKQHTSSTRKILQAIMQLYDRIINPNLLIRRLTISFNNIKNEEEKDEEKIQYEQMRFFVDYEKLKKEEEKEKQYLKKERALQESIIHLKKKFGKNAVLKAANLQKGATAKDRNSQIGGHKA